MSIWIIWYKLANMKEEFFEAYDSLAGAQQRLTTISRSEQDWRETFQEGYLAVLKRRNETFRCAEYTLKSFILEFQI